MNNRDDIRAIIVDDEQNAHDNLQYLLKQYCPQVAVVGNAFTVDDAVCLIQKNNPNLVFLDIEMPQKSGFELFNHIDTITFQTIFVTAYDQYAIRAFSVAAIDYLLKPIAIDLLQNAVQKVASKQQEQNMIARIRAFQENNAQTRIKKLSIPYKSDYVIVAVENILYIEADRMYSIIHLKEKTTASSFVYAKKLSHFEEILQANTNFCRTHRSWMVNLDHVSSYSKKEHQLHINEHTQIPVSKSYKLSVEQKLGFSI